VAVSAQLAVHPCNLNVLEGLLGTGTSVRYLAEYLGALGATSIILEPNYVDRHYLDDFVRHYSRSFQAPSPKCSRLHFFATTSADELDQCLDCAVQGEQERVNAQSRLTASYLGFVVRRPLRGPAMGRTVLRTYPPDGRRHYTVVRRYRVNLAGIRLEVEGLAYQQQDGGAAVCASTALWSALQRIAHVAGHRTPTPSQITAAARSPYPPSHGLNHLQMAEALSTLGYIADEFPAASDAALFRTRLVSCLDSQLPVVLLLERRVGLAAEGHAVTVTGYGEPSTSAAIALPGLSGKLRLRGAALEVLYVHDDNLGSHAHYELLDQPGNGKPCNLKLRRGRSGSSPSEWWTSDEWCVAGALVPKPDKMRLPIESLFGVVLTLQALLGQRVLPGIDLEYAPRFQSGVTYVQNAIGMTLARGQRASFFRSLSLPRHIGVISVYGLCQHLVDVVLDATAVAHGPPEGLLLALIAPGVPHNSAAGKNLDTIAKQLGLPCISGG
jgi:hypothetical protein